MCGLVFTDTDTLGEHTQLTHTEVSWKCKLCGKFFAEERHMLLHEVSGQLLVMIHVFVSDVGQGELSTTLIPLKLQYQYNLWFDFQLRTDFEEMCSLIIPMHMKARLLMLDVMG